MTLQERLRTVNEGHVFVCFCLFWWIVLVGLRADNLPLPYWAVFIPLWFWKVVVVVGWLTGVIVWFKQRNKFTTSGSINTLEDPSLSHVQAMSVSTFFALLLCCSEVMLYLHLSLPSLQLSYLTIFTPLVLVGLFGIMGFVLVMVDCQSIFRWTYSRRYGAWLRTRSNETQERGYDNTLVAIHPRRTCTFTLELYIALNLLQILFLIARLDNWIRSKWTVTFIPTFILLGMGSLVCIVGFTISFVRYHTAFFVPRHQRQIPIRYYASYAFINLLLCTSVTILTLRLDSIVSSDITFSFITSPVLLSLIIYSLNAFYTGPGNPWWFGLNGNISQTLFLASPTLQLFANTSVSNPTEFWKRSNGRHMQHNDSESHSDMPQTPDVSTGSTSAFQSHIGLDIHASPARDQDVRNASQESTSTIRAFSPLLQHRMCVTEQLSILDPYTLTNQLEKQGQHHLTLNSSAIGRGVDQSGNEDVHTPD